VRDAVVHELTHAALFCIGAKYSDCNRGACNELIALITAGECRPGGSFYRPGVSEETCLVDAAYGSISWYFGSGECTRAMVEAQFRNPICRGEWRHLSK